MALKGKSRYKTTQVTRKCAKPLLESIKGNLSFSTCHFSNFFRFSTTRIYYFCNYKNHHGGYFFTAWPEILSPLPSLYLCECLSGAGAGATSSRKASRPWALSGSRELDSQEPEEPPAHASRGPGRGAPEPGPGAPTQPHYHHHPCFAS